MNQETNLAENSASPPPPDAPPTPEREMEDAVVPLDEIPVEDVKEGASIIDQWLRDMTKGVVNLDRLRMVAGSLPVIGNIMALVDSVGDIFHIVKNKCKVSIMEWISLGINMIGLVPGPGAAARMSLRPMLTLVKQQLRMNAVNGLSDAIITLLERHLNARIAGAIESFVETAQQKINSILTAAADLSKEYSDNVAKAMTAIANGELDAVGDWNSGAAKITDPDRYSIYSPIATIGNMFDAMGDMASAGGKYVTNKASQYLMPTGAKNLLLTAASDFKDFGGRVKEKLESLATPQDIATGLTIMNMLIALAAAVKKWRDRRRRTQSSNSQPDKTSTAQQNTRGDELGSTRNQRPTNQDASPCRCNPGASPNSISYSSGSETISHTDASLPGIYSFSVMRTYRSSLRAYDGGELGSRWISGFTIRFDIHKKGLVYHSADGRSHNLPHPKIGAFHVNAIEGFTVLRVNDNELSLLRGSEFKEHYEKFGKTYRLTGIEQNDGSRLTLGYHHTNGSLSDMIAHQGDVVFAHIAVQHDEKGRISALHQVKDGKLASCLASYTYDEAGDLVEAIDQYGHKRNYYYRNHLVTRYTDRTGRGMNLQWDNYGSKAKAIREWADDGTYDTRIDWSKNIRLAYVTDALGNETRYYYDYLGYTYRIVHPDGLNEWFFRDKAKNIKTHIHPDGRVDEYIYDDKSNLLQHTKPDGRTIHFAYNEDDQVAKIMDAEGGLWLRDYDQKGNLIESIDPLGNKTEYAYDDKGQLIEITNAKGGKSQITYNDLGLMTSHTDCSGKTQLWKYNEQGQLIAEVRPTGETTQYHYDKGQLVEIIHPDGTKETSIYDAEGRILTRIDAQGQQSSWIYGQAGQLMALKQPNGSEINYKWDRKGQLTALYNENNQPVQFKYDKAGRLTSEIGVDGQLKRYEYHPLNGELVAIHTALRTINFEYDAAGRLKERSAGFKKTEQDHENEFVELREQAANLAKKAGQYFNYRSFKLADLPEHLLPNPLKDRQTERYTWDGNGKMLMAENAHSKLQWFYDAAGNLVREHQYRRDLPGHPVARFTHEYDVLNNRIATIRPDGHRTSLLTYGSGHVHGMLIDDIELLAIERDDLHREVSRVQSNGLMQSVAYDPMGRMIKQNITKVPKPVAVQATGGSAPLVQKRHYTYSRTGELLGKHSLSGDITYRYDSLGRLTEAISPKHHEHFAFDPAGNPLSDPRITHYEQEISNQSQAIDVRLSGLPRILTNMLKEYVGIHYDYDDDGYLKQKLDNGEKHLYTWDAFGRLHRQETHRGKIRYLYDPLGRRISKEIDYKSNYANLSDRAQAKAPHTEPQKQTHWGKTFYLWEGDTLAIECVIHEEQTRHYLYEPASFVPAAQASYDCQMTLLKEPAVTDYYDIDQDPLWQREIEPTAFSQIHYYQCDHLGTPQELTDHTGEIAWQANYKAWGEAEEIISDAARKARLKNSIRFQGQYFDEESGLHYNRHRYYDPKTGRFISKDPIGLAGGLNFYQYADNPTGWTDPQGLSCGSQTLNRNLGGKANDDMQAHHVIPELTWNDHQPFFTAIGLTAQDRDKASNGLLMPSSEAKARQMRRAIYHCSRHRVYTAGIDHQLTQIENEYNSGRINQSEARSRVDSLQNAARLTLSAPLVPGTRPTRLF